MPDTQHIEIAFESSCASIGKRTIKWLINTGIATPGRILQKSGSGFICLSLTATRRIASDSAIVFVSDEATSNADWQAYVRAVPQNMRVLPVGVINDVDYNDEAVLPKRIEEINFIRTDEYMMENILDSLTTDPAFFTLKNQLLLQYNRWAASDSKTDFLSDSKKIQEYMTLVSERLSEEKDKYLRQQLQNIMEYLRASQKYVKTSRRMAALRWTGRGILILATIGMLGVFSYFKSTYRQATYANIALSVDADSSDAVYGAIKMVEAIRNPTSPPGSMQVAYKKLHSFMDKPWQQTPIGVMYNYEILDTAIPDGSRYIWTGDSSGRVARWDTYTGRIVKKKTISEAGIIRITVSADEKSLTALDLNGNIYSGNGKRFKCTGFIDSISPVNAELAVSGDQILVYDERTIILIESSKQLKLDTGTESFTVMCAGFKPDGNILVAGSQDERLTILSFTPDGVCTGTESHDNIRIGSLSKAVMLNGIWVVCDSSGQIWKIEEHKAKRTDLVLEKAIDIALVNSSTLVYQERNLGTGLYDLDASFDYGDVLSDLHGVRSIWASPHLLAAKVGDVLCSICLDDILYVQKKTAIDSQTVYDNTSAQADLSATDGLGLKSAVINADGTITLEMIIQDKGATTAVLNPAQIIPDSSDSSSNQDVAQYQNEPFFLNGKPTVVGIRLDPENELSNTAGYTLLVGSSDGCVAQVWFNYTDGSSTCIGVHTIPSRGAVRAIHETGNDYLIEDNDGRLWKCASSANLMTMDGMYNAVNAKLHAAVTKDLKDIISKQVWRKLELKVYPGGDGKEWD